MLSLVLSVDKGIPFDNMHRLMGREVERGYNDTHIVGNICAIKLDDVFGLRVTVNIVEEWQSFFAGKEVGLLWQVAQMDTWPHTLYLDPIPMEPSTGPTLHKDDVVLPFHPDVRDEHKHAFVGKDVDYARKSDICIGQIITVLISDGQVVIRASDSEIGRAWRATIGLHSDVTVGSAYSLHPDFGIIGNPYLIWPNYWIPE